MRTSVLLSLLTVGLTLAFHVTLLCAQTPGVCAWPSFVTPWGNHYIQWPLGRTVDLRKEGATPTYFTEDSLRIATAVATWDVPCNELTIKFPGYDEGIVTFVTQGWSDGSGTAGATTGPVPNPETGYLEGAFLIKVNCDEFDEDDWWDDDSCPPGNKLDLESVMLHELGHASRTGSGVRSMFPLYSNGWGHCERRMSTDSSDRG